MTVRLDIVAVERPLSERTRARLDRLEAFSTITSTSTYLLSQPPPPKGQFRVAIADQQTSGRGRNFLRWASPKGMGLYLSFAYTFAAMPKQLPALTLALGVGVIDALKALGIEGVNLKWPNDFVVSDSKLGGILSEVQSGNGKVVTVVAGVGINLDLGNRTDLAASSGWAKRATDMRSITAEVPTRELLAGTVIEQLYLSCVRYEADGFAGFIDAWRELDWLRGREVLVRLPQGELRGVAAGIDDDGALLVDTESGRETVISGSIVTAEPGAADA
jgi:BirA family biotin operon repressor/biotin-[acetyl-CoA-carboxylase] ligase